MECLEIDWKNIDDTFVRDEFYESFQAPKWIDFNAPEQPVVDAHEWFCGKVGCTHDEKPFCQAPPSILSTAPEPQETSKILPSPLVPIAVAAAVAPLAEKLVSAATGKRARGLVSTSLSSLPDIKAGTFIKSKPLHHTQMPPIAERKVQVLKKTIRHASENEHPSQLCKAQGGLPTAAISRIQENVAKKIKRSEQKDAGKETKVNVEGREVQSRVFKEVSSISEYRVMSGVSKISRSVTSLERRVLSQGRSIVCKNAGKEQFADVSNLCSGFKKPEGTRAPPLSGPSSRLVVRNSHFMSSSLTLSSKKVAVVSQSLTSACLKNETSVPSRPPRIVARKGANPPSTKFHRTRVPLPGELKKNDCGEENKIAAEATPLHEELHSLEVREEQLLTETEIHAVGGEQDPYQPTLVKESQPDRQFLVEITLVDQDPRAFLKNDDNSFEEKPCPGMENEVFTQQVFIGKPLSMERSERSEEEDPQDQIGKEKDVVEHTLEDFLRNLHLTTPEDESGILVSDGLGGDCADQEMVLSARSSSQSAASSQLSKPRSSVEGSHAMSVISQGSSSVAVFIETTRRKAAPDINNDYGEKITDTKRKKQNLHLPSRPRSQGKKRKSSELNFKVDCSGKCHIPPIKKAISTQPPVTSSLSLQFEDSSARFPAGTLSQTCSDSCKGQHKKMKTTAVQSFKPFRLRTEERGALKELGLSKELGPPTLQEIVHHALRMPSFGHPFVPQRSTKKLTVPKEPKFHPSRTRKTCTKHAMVLAS